MIKLSISNIAWAAENDTEMYQCIKENGYQGIEIAPTRIFPEAPYDNLLAAKDWASKLKNQYEFEVPSMQSIWYGHKEKIFGTKEERKALVDYTKKAILFAETIGCKNLVFGNPKNRDTEDVPGNYSTAIDFFREIGDYAYKNNTVIAIEPNPTIYNTRFLNFTEQAVELAYKSGSEGVKVNFDLGTVIYNSEDISYLGKVIEFINHVHISEPGLKIIEERELHKQLFRILHEKGYNRFVSLEMGCQKDINNIKSVIDYLKNIYYETICS